MQSASKGIGPASRCKAALLVYLDEGSIISLRSTRCIYLGFKKYPGKYPTPTITSYRVSSSLVDTRTVRRRCDDVYVHIHTRRSGHMRTSTIQSEFPNPSYGQVDNLSGYLGSGRVSEHVTGPITGRLCRSLLHVAYKQAFPRTSVTA
jgi:hypothetical protein